MIKHLVKVESSFKKKINIYRPFFKKTKRINEIKQPDIFSRKLYFYPEFLSAVEKNFFFRIKKNNNENFARKKGYLFQILGLIYGIIILKRLFFSQTKYFYVLTFCGEKITLYTRSFFFILTSSLLFSQKANSSKSIEQTLVGGGIFVFFFEIENILFFFAKNPDNFFLLLTVHAIIVFAFWTQKKDNKALKKNFSKTIISFREIKILFTTFSVIKIFFQGIFNISLFKQDKIFFPFFFTNWAAYVSQNNLLQFSRNIFFLKAGFILFFLFLKLFFLYYHAFLTKLIKKNPMFPFIRFSLFFQLVFTFKKKKKLKIRNSNSFFLIRPNGLSTYINDFFLEDYSSKNFSFFNQDDSRWKIRKKGINVPFSDSFWNNESSFIKKKLSWEIKSSKN